MKLDLKERLSILGMLPQEGDMFTLKILRDLQGNLSFTEREIKDLEIVQRDGVLNWNPRKDKGKEVEIGEKANDIIVLALSKLNEEKKLRMEHYGLYERFIDKKDGV